MRRNRGDALATVETSDVARSERTPRSFPINSKRARAYAAGIAIATPRRL